jgi:hypothetical protein
MLTVIYAQHAPVPCKSGGFLSRGGFYHFYVIKWSYKKLKEDIFKEKRFWIGAKKTLKLDFYKSSDKVITITKA